MAEDELTTSDFSAREARHERWNVDGNENEERIHLLFRVLLFAI